MAFILDRYKVAVQKLLHSDLFDAAEDEGSFTASALRFRDDLLSEIQELTTLYGAVEVEIPQYVKTEIEGYLTELAIVVEEFVEHATELRDRRGRRSDEYMSGLPTLAHKAASETAKARQSRQLGIFSALRSLQTTTSDLRELESGLRAAEGEVKELLKQLKQQESVLADKVDEKQQAIAAAKFQERAYYHAKWEYRYIGLFTVAVALTVWAFVSTVSAEYQHLTNKWMFLSYVLHNGVKLGAASLLLRFAVTRWNLERNLRLLYSHRVAAVEQYRLFDLTISPDEREAKDRLRLAVAHSLLADPVTGYREPAASDVGGATIVNTVMDRLPKQS